MEGIWPVLEVQFTKKKKNGVVPSANDIGDILDLDEPKSLCVGNLIPCAVLLKGGETLNNGK